MLVPSIRSRGTRGHTRKRRNPRIKMKKNRHRRRHPRWQYQNPSSEGVFPLLAVSGDEAGHAGRDFSRWMLSSLTVVMVAVVFKGVDGFK
jgi:hypothetical protein